MKIPKSIKVGGHTYEVNWEPNLAKTEGRQGRIIYPLHEITLLTDLHPEELSEAFIHEVLHAIDHHYMNDHLNEDDTSGIAEGLFQVLSDMGITFER